MVKNSKAAGAAANIGPKLLLKAEWMQMDFFK